MPSSSDTVGIVDNANRLESPVAMEEKDLPSSTVEVINDTPFIVDNSKLLENAIAMTFGDNDQVDNFLARSIDVNNCQFNLEDYLFDGNNNMINLSSVGGEEVENVVQDKQVTGPVQGQGKGVKNIKLVPNEEETPTTASPSHPWEDGNGVGWTSGGKEGGNIVTSTVPQSSNPQPIGQEQSTVESVNDGVGARHGKKETGPKHGDRKVDKNLKHVCNELKKRNELKKPKISTLKLKILGNCSVNPEKSKKFIPSRKGQDAAGKRVFSKFAPGNRPEGKRRKNGWAQDDQDKASHGGAHSQDQARQVPAGLGLGVGAAVEESRALIQKSSCSKPQMSLLSNKSVKVQHYREDPVMFVNVKCDAVERDNR